MSLKNLSAEIAIGEHSATLETNDRRWLVDYVEDIITQIQADEASEMEMMGEDYEKGMKALLDGLAKPDNR